MNNINRIIEETEEKIAKLQREGSAIERTFFCIGCYFVALLLILLCIFKWILGLCIKSIRYVIHVIKEEEKMEQEARNRANCQSIYYGIGENIFHYIVENAEIMEVEIPKLLTDIFPEDENKLKIRKGFSIFCYTLQMKKNINYDFELLRLMTNQELLKKWHVMYGNNTAYPHIVAMKHDPNLQNHIEIQVMYVDCKEKLIFLREFEKRINQSVQGNCDSNIEDEDF